MKLLLYCTKAKPMLRKLDNYFLDKHNDNYYWKKGQPVPYKLNGKIVAECDFEVEEIRPEKYWHSTEDFDYIYNTGTLYYDDLLKKSCLMDYELDDYLGCEDKGYAIHIKNLHIFDYPKELSYCLTEKSYKIIDKIFTDEIMTDGKWYRPVNKAPQNMMRVKRVLQEDGILISIQPQWLCKILNGEKTVEIRKKVLKEMLG